MAANEIPKSIKASLYIDGKPAEASLQNVQQQARTLDRELSKLTVGTQAWNDKLKEVQTHKKFLSEVKDEVNGVGGAFAKLQSELGSVGLMAGAYVAFEFLSEKFMNTVTSSAKLSDSLADLRRVTGLSEAGVTSLNSALGKIDTRTSGASLREIGVIAGKLGVSSGEILKFTEATDKLTVALGDELGDADAITTKLGKILNVYDGEVTAENITTLGNAFVGLANAGVASAGFLSDFTQRMAPMAATANMSKAATLGIGAALEELGAKSEASSTAVTTLLSTIASDLPNAARIAGMDVAEFTKQFNENAETGLLNYAKGLMANKAAFSEVAAGLKDAGEEGARVVTTIAMLGAKTAFVNEKIQTANKLILEAGEINEAFRLKNETLGAQVDKLGKQFAKVATSSTVIDFMKSLVTVTGAALTVVSNHATAIANITKLLFVAGTAWAAYTIATKIATAEKLSFLSAMLTAQRLQQLEIVTVTALSVVTNLAAGNFKKAAAEFRFLSAAMGTNPWGLAIAGIVALGAAFVVFTERVTQAEKIQKAFNDIEVDAAKSIAAEKNNIESLNKVIKDETATKELKLAAVKKLIEIMPEYLQSYSQEEIAAGKADNAIQGYIRTIEKRAKAEAAGKKLADLDGEITDLEARRKAGFKGASFWEKTQNAFSGQNKGENQMQAYDRKLVQEIKEKTEQRDEVRKVFQEDVKKSLEAPTIDTAPVIQEVRSLDFLKKKLEEVTKARGAQAVGSAKFIALTKEMNALQAEINKADNKAPKPAAKDTAINQAISEAEKLDERFKKLNLQRLNDQLSQNAKEIEQEKQKYDELIAQEIAFQATKDPKGKLKKEKAESKVRQGALESNRDTAVKDLALRQEAEMLTKIQEMRDQFAVIQESQLEKEKQQINKFYDDLARENAGNKDALALIDINRTQELNAADLREKKRLEEDKARIEAEYDTLTGTRRENKIARINKQYDEEIEALKRKYSKGLIATQEYKDAEALILRNKAAATQLNQAEQAQQAKEFTINAAQQAADATFSIISNSQKAELDHKLKSIEAQRTQELSKKNLTEKQKEEINRRFDAKVREEKIKAFEQERKANIAQAMINGALAVTKVLAQTGVLAPFAIPAIVAGTLAQVAVIAAQPAPEYAAGGMSNEDPAGYVSKATLFNKSASGRPFVAGEKGREWIAPNWMVESPRFANIIGSLEVARREKRAFAAGGFNQVQPVAGSAPAAADLSRLESLMHEMITAQKQANNKKVILVYSELKKFMEDTETAILQQSA